MIDTRFYNIAAPIALKELAQKLACEIVHPRNPVELDGILIDGIADLKSADNRKLTFFTNAKYQQQFLNTKAVGCFVDSKESQVLESAFLLQSDNPYYAYRNAIELFYQQKVSKKDLFELNGSYISASAKIGSNIKLGYGVVIESDVEIGDNCCIDSNSVIKTGVKIGNNAHIGASSSLACCIIGDDFISLSGARIGQDGFGFAPNKGINYKILHVGRVIIGNNVEIGANTTVDRGALTDTIIEDMSKIDNLVQIGHGVEIGKGCFIAGQVGIAGSAKIGNYCAIGGQVGIIGHIEIADMTEISGGSVVIKTISQKATTVGGYPAVPVQDWHRQTIYLKNIIKK
jgi:UDP-3-O-[3-hydroxymyristoyl] glucosamine N-acyltransferase